MLRTFTIALLLAAAMSGLFAQTNPEPASKDKEAPAAPKPPEKKWYEIIKLSGYSQVRYNRLLETNPDLGCEQCDKSWGDNNGFFFRRIRLKFSGYLHKQVYFYIQTDFASAVSSNLHYGQLRDAYFDFGLDKNNEFRIRVGQSKVPFGFENLQSSQNRLPLDRDDALNSAAPNERDLGAFFMYAPKVAREHFAALTKDGLRGSGDYGVFAVGVYDGQTANKPEVNNNQHVVARLSYPFKLKSGQFIEPGIQAYTGKFDLLSTTKNVKSAPNNRYTDERVAASIVVYPQPFGFQAEYNLGKSPEYNTQTDTIETSNLKGGYVMAHYNLWYKKQLFSPFVRYQFYDGGKKHELDARSYSVRDWEIGVEWQPVKNMEINATYTIADRRYEDKANPVNRQKGNLLRLQLQVNY